MGDRLRKLGIVSLDMRVVSCIMEFLIENQSSGWIRYIPLHLEKGFNPFFYPSYALISKTYITKSLLSTKHFQSHAYIRAQDKKILVSFSAMEGGAAADFSILKIPKKFIYIHSFIYSVNACLPSSSQLWFMVTHKEE